MLVYKVDNIQVKEILIYLKRYLRKKESYENNKQNNKKI